MRGLPFGSTLALLALALALIWPSLSQADGLPTLPPTLLERLDNAAPGLLEEAGELILTYGQDGRITGEGIELAIGHERAQRRAREMAQLWAADLNDDGAVSRAEMEVHAGSYSPAVQSRRLMALMRADADSDGVATGAEIRAFAQGRALSLFDDEKAGEMRALLGCDSDGDGAVSLAEIARMIEQRQTRGDDKSA